MSDTCLNCKFSRGQSEALECRRNPPIGDERFPLVRDNQWCGEFLVSELAAVSPAPSPQPPTPKQAGYQPERPAGVADIPPEELTSSPTCLGGGGGGGMRSASPLCILRLFSTICLP